MADTATASESGVEQEETNRGAQEDHDSEDAKRDGKNRVMVGNRVQEKLMDLQVKDNEVAFFNRIVEVNGDDTIGIEVEATVGKTEIIDAELPDTNVVEPDNELSKLLRQVGASSVEELRYKHGNKIMFDWDKKEIISTQNPDTFESNSSWDMSNAKSLSNSPAKYAAFWAMYLLGFALLAYGVSLFDFDFVNNIILLTWLFLLISPPVIKGLVDIYRANKSIEKDVSELQEFLVEDGD